MTDRLEIRDEALEAAGMFLVAAVGDMAESSRTLAPPEMESLTGIGDDVRHFVQGLQTGRLALADAAKTAGSQIAGAMSDSGELDAAMAQRLHAGFAVVGSER